MSWQATSYVAELTENITRSEKLVMLCLANRHHPDTGRIFPSIARLADESLMSTRTCIRCLQTLESKGFVRIHRARGIVNHYEIVGLGTSDKTSDKMSQVQNGTGDKTNGTSDISSGTSDIAMSHEPKEEPTIRTERFTERVLREREERKAKRTKART